MLLFQIDTAFLPFLNHGLSSINRDICVSDQCTKHHKNLPNLPITSPYLPIPPHYKFLVEFELIISLAKYSYTTNYLRTERIYQKHCQFLHKLFIYKYVLVSEHSSLHTILTLVKKSKLDLRHCRVLCI